MHWQNRIKFKSSQPCPAPIKTPIHFGGVDTGILLGALENSCVLLIKPEKAYIFYQSEAQWVCKLEVSSCLVVINKAYLSELDATSTHGLLLMDFFKVGSRRLVTADSFQN